MNAKELLLKIIKKTTFWFIFAVGLFNILNFTFNRSPNHINIKFDTDILYLHVISHPVKGKKLRYKIKIKTEGEIHFSQKPKKPKKKEKKLSIHELLGMPKPKKFKQVDHNKWRNIHSFEID